MAGFVVTTEVHEVGNRIAGEFKWHGRTYRLLGNRITPNFVSGTYEDIVAGYTLHGAFQLQVFPKEQFMVGRWMGFNRDNHIVEGPWEWRRLASATKGDSTAGKTSKYPFETDPSSSTLHNPPTETGVREIKNA